MPHPKYKVTVSFYRNSDKELIRKLKQLGVAAKEDFKDVIHDSALNITTDAKKRLRDWPAVDTGRLRSSIRPTFFRNGLVAEIGTNVDYSAFVEFGTGRRGSTTIGKYVGTVPDGWRYGTVPGMAARPYLHPAFFAEERNLLRAVDKIIDDRAKRMRGKR